MGITITKEESDAFPEIADGEIFLAECKSVKLKEKKNRDGETYEQLEWKFVIIDDGEQNERTIYGKTSTKFVDHPDCKFNNWSQSILGEFLPIDEPVDTDDLLDRECRIVVYRDEYEKDGRDKVYNGVRDVLPTREAARKMAEAQDEPF